MISGHDILAVGKEERQQIQEEFPRKNQWDCEAGGTGVKEHLQASSGDHLLAWMTGQVGGEATH